MRVVNIIPTYNERENVEKMLLALKRVARENKKYEFVTLVVDDNSPDGTAKIVRKFKGVYLLTGEKRGLGVAMARGIIYALKTLRADVVITNEADFAFDPFKIPKLLKKLSEGYDVVIASRHVGDGKTEGWTWVRRLNHFAANTVFATWVAGARGVSDHNGAFRAVKAEVLRKMDWRDMPRGFGFFNYWLFKMTQVTDKICEIPVTYRFRTQGESKVSFNPKYIKTYLRDVIEYMGLCLRIRRERN